MMKHTELHSLEADRLLSDSLEGFAEAALFPADKLTKVPYWKKLWNEKRLEKLLRDLMDDLEPHMSELAGYAEDMDDKHSDTVSRVKQLVTKTLKEIDEKRLLFDRPFLTYFMSQGYMDVAEHFIERAKKEDPNLKNEEIFQALRNVWIMNSLQLLWDQPLTLTSPMYAYSMLYPYTDNLLDDPDVSGDIKEAFNDRLKRVLSGESVEGLNAKETRMFDLVEDIHAAFPPENNPEVCESIMLIQAAQIDSMRQCGEDELTKEDLLKISFYKGGTSVLADAFLVRGSLSYEEMLFSYQYGAFLQLLDDLQDKDEDTEQGNQTLFSRIKLNEKADDDIRQVIAYIYSVNTKSASDSNHASLLKEVIGQCTLLMIMEAVGRNPDTVSVAFYKELEACSKVRLSFYRKLNEKISTFIKESELLG
ncbi:hypothetical protein IRB23M11_17970 [Alkalibacterium sp. m-11]|uniref:Uncharacterized protein n=1 Tax=Alkalibacterium indicireducens TaxID=398758 RepID=A0ABP3KH06_9LACT